MTTRSLEFHDSELLSIVSTNDTTEILLRGYVHQWERRDGAWHGTGWTQGIRILVQGAFITGGLPDLPIGLSDGDIVTRREPLHGLVDLPFHTQEPAAVTMTTTCGVKLEISGQSLSVTSKGEPEFVEPLPDDFAPVEDS